MNLPTKLTMSRLFLTIVIILLFLFPFNQMGISFPSYALTINNEILEIDSIEKMYKKNKLDSIIENIKNKINN